MSRVRAGRAFIDIGVRDRVSRELRQIANNVQAVGARIARIGFGGAAIGAGIVAGFAPAIRAASNFEESLNRFNAVFGENSAAARQFAQEFGAAIGRSEADLLDALSSFQSFFVGLEFDGGDAQGLSQTITQLTRDFASFNNLTDEEATQRFISALSGSSEVLDKFGVNIRAAALDQEFLNQGLDVTTTTATEQQKVLARLGIITRALNSQGAIGDAERTQASFANQVKRLQGQLTDLAIAVGNAVIPVFNRLITSANQVLERVVSFTQANPRLIQTFLGVGAAVAAAGALIGSFGIAIIVAGQSVSILSSSVRALTASFAFLRTASLGLTATFAALGISITGPVGLIVGGIAAVTAFGVAIVSAVALSTRAGRELAGSIASSFGSVLSIVGDTIGGIVSALTTGQIGLAGEIALAGLEAAFFEGTAQILENWREWAIQLGRIVFEVIDQIGRGFNRFFQGVAAGVGQVAVSVNRLRGLDFAGAQAALTQAAADVAIGVTLFFDEDALRNAARGAADDARDRLNGLLEEFRQLQETGNQGNQNFEAQINSLQQRINAATDELNEQQNRQRGNLREQRGSVLRLQNIDQLLAEFSSRAREEDLLGTEDFRNGIRELIAAFQTTGRWR